MDTYPRRLVEPFAGGATVGLTALCEGYVDRLTLVELDDRVAHFWAVVFSPLAEELARRVEEVPDLDAAYAMRDMKVAADDDVGRALHVLLTNRTKYNGNLSDTADDVGRDCAEPPDDFRFSPERLARRIRTLAARRNAVDVVQGDALAMLPELTDAPGTVFYLDLPYSLPGGPAESLYAHWLLNHGRLTTMAGALEGDVLFSHQDHPFVRRAARTQSFQLAQVRSSRRKDARVELLMARDLSWLAAAKLLHTKLLTPLAVEALRGVTLDLLPVFIVVAEELHFARAAARLGIHPSKVTRGIQQLEGELATALVIRSTQGASLTDAGNRLYAGCRPALERIGKALRKA